MEDIKFKTIGDTFGFLDTSHGYLKSISWIFKSLWMSGWNYCSKSYILHCHRLFDPFGNFLSELYGLFEAFKVRYVLWPKSV